MAEQREMLNSERKEFQSKIRALVEEKELLHTQLMLQVNRVLNTAYTSGIIDTVQLVYLQEEIKKL